MSLVLAAQFGMGRISDTTYQDLALERGGKLGSRSSINAALFGH
jgi:hypothetical protein